MSSRARLVLALFGFSLLLAVSACDDEDDDSSDETGETSGGW